MFTAIDINNQLVDIDTANRKLDNKYFCRDCGGEVIIKNGNVRVSHFAHKSKCCYGEYKEMTEWHKEWQSKFPLKNREVILKIDENDIRYEFLDKYTRRADVLCYGYVIELQNSPITSKEFDERNYFYNILGKKVIWIFNMINIFNSDKIECYDEWNSNNQYGGKYKWKYPSKTFINFKKYSDNVIIFQSEEINKNEKEEEQLYLQRVNWAIDINNDDKDTDFSRFMTIDYPLNFTQLLKMIRQKKL